MRRIGVDARFLGEAGPGRYIKNLLRELELIDEVNLYYVFMRESAWDQYHPQHPNFIKVPANYVWYGWSEQLLFPINLMLHKLDLFYVPHFNIPVFYPGKIVIALADLIMHAFSTSQGSSLPRPYYSLKKFVYTQVVKRAVTKATKIIVPSHATKNDLMAYYPQVSEKKVVVSYEGLDPELAVLRVGEMDAQKVMEKYGVKPPFALYVGSSYEHKNLELLLKVWRGVVEKLPDKKGQLVLVGKNDLYAQKLMEKIKEQALGDVVSMPGLKNKLSDWEVNALRQKANLYVFPSLKEGFSLTPLEAMNFGLPCLLSSIPCHQEIYQDAASYFDPQSASDLEQKLLDLWSNPQLREKLVIKGKEMVKKYSWSSTAKDTLTVFQEVLPHR